MAGDHHCRSSTGSSSLASIFSLVMLGAVAGAAVTFRIAAKNATESLDRDTKQCCSKESDPPNRTTTTQQQQQKQQPHWCSCNYDTKRERLPLLVILVRHGESEGNVDQKAWWRKADHDIRLTEKGQAQAERAGERIEEIFRAYDEEARRGGPSVPHPIKHVHLHVSPFERTVQTALHALPAFGHRVTHYKLCPRLREQEFGNLQGEEFARYRKEQKTVGRFWYRFPTGESGADVLHRVRSWWVETLLPINLGHNRSPGGGSSNNESENENENETDGGNPRLLDDHYVDAVVVFSHGLTIRSILCQLFRWSIYTYSSVYNAKNCDLYVLKRDLTKPGASPYVLDGEHGDLPTSSIDVGVTLSRARRDGSEESKNNNNNNDNNKDDDDNNNNKNDENGREPPPSETAKKNEDPAAVWEPRTYKLMDYLSIPAPRRDRVQEIKTKLAEQYPDDFPGGASDIASISFQSFCLGEPPQLPKRGSPDQQLRERERERSVP